MRWLTCAVVAAMSGCGGDSRVACTTTPMGGGPRTCVEHMLSGQAAQATIDDVKGTCMTLKGTLSQSCERTGAIGSCTATNVTPTTTWSTVTYYYDASQRTQAQADCQSPAKWQGF